VQLTGAAGAGACGAWLTPPARPAAALTAHRALLTPEQLATLPPLSEPLGRERQLPRRREEAAEEEAIDEETGRRPPRRAGAPDAQADLGAQPLPPLSAAALSALTDAAAAAVRRGDPEVAQVLLFAHNRPSYLRRTLESVLRVHAGDSRRFPLTVSQDVGGADPDGAQAAVAAVAREFESRAAGALRFQQHAQAAAGELALRKPTDNPGYYHIAAHYRWALARAFDGGARRVLLLEDDMELAPDFFEYFAALAGVLDADDSLWCISSWNDNGRAGLASDPLALARTDFFPGLGWMMDRRLWEEQLRDSWPDAFWDDWMRLNETRRGRQCVRPELCRTYNFGRRGTSGAGFFDKHLREVVLAQHWVGWAEQDLGFLAEPASYEASFLRALGGAARARTLAQARRAAGDVALPYGDQAEYARLATQLGAFSEWREGMPRASYRGVVQLSLNDGATRLFLAPADYLERARAVVAAALREAREGEEAETGE